MLLIIALILAGQIHHSLHSSLDDRCRHDRLREWHVPGDFMRYLRDENSTICTMQIFAAEILPPKIKRSVILKAR